MDIQEVLIQWHVDRECGRCLQKLYDAHPDCHYTGQLFRAERLEIEDIEGIIQGDEQIADFISASDWDLLRDGATLSLSSEAIEFIIKASLITDGEWRSFSKTIDGAKRFIIEHGEQSSYEALPVVYTKTSSPVSGLDLALLGEKNEVANELIQSLKAIEEVYARSDSYKVEERPNIAVYYKHHWLYVARDQFD